MVIPDQDINPKREGDLRSSGFAHSSTVAIYFFALPFPNKREKKIYSGFSDLENLFNIDGMK